MVDNKTVSVQLSPVSPGIYQVKGDLTFSTVNFLRELPDQILTSKTTPKILLNKVNHIDSAGLALLIDWARQSLDHHPIVFAQANNQLLRLVKLYNLDTVLPLYR